MASPEVSSPYMNTRPRTEDVQRRLKGRHKMDEKEGTTLRACLGHDDLPKESKYSNLAHIKDYHVCQAQDLMVSGNHSGSSTLAHEDEDSN